MRKLEELGGLEAAKDETTEQAMQRYGLRDKLQAARELAEKLRDRYAEAGDEVPDYVADARAFLKMLEEK